MGNCIMTPEYLGERFCSDFRKGFALGAPWWYDIDKTEAKSVCRWCEPWTWADPEDWHDPDLTAREMGERWAQLNFERMQVLYDDAEEMARIAQEREAEELADACLY